jgi:hypothetical protein
MLWSRWMLISKGRSRKVEIFMLLNCMYWVILSWKHGMICHQIFRKVKSSIYLSCDRSVGSSKLFLERDCPGKVVMW